MRHIQKHNKINEQTKKNLKQTIKGINKLVLFRDDIKVLTEIQENL